MNPKLSNRIKECRLELKYNQPELARVLKVSKQTVSNWENGNRTPDADTLLKLSDLFNCSVDYLLGKTNNKNNCVIESSYNNENIKIELEGKEINLTEDEIQDLINKLGEVGFDVKKLIKK